MSKSAPQSKHENVMPVHLVLPCLQVLQPPERVQCVNGRMTEINLTTSL